MGKPHNVSVHPNGRVAYVGANEDSNDVSIVDLETDSVTNIRVGNAPRKIVVQTAAAQQRSSSRRITINGFAFVPSLVELSPGETVTWMNDDGAPHNISVKDRAASETLIPGSNDSTNFEYNGD